MNSREYILQQLRSAAPGGEKPDPGRVNDKDVFSDMVWSKAELLDQFILRQQELSGEVFLCPSVPDMAKKLHSLLQGFAASSCLCHVDPLIDKIFSEEPALRNFFDLSDQADLSSPAFAGYQVGLTGADVLVARTGSLIVNSINAGGRRLSVLPPVHIAVARESQMVPSLEQAFGGLANIDVNWSYATIITGPSRTSDIEKKLVLGAHGPKRLVTLILKD